jgi:hypothetical protein
MLLSTTLVVALATQLPIDTIARLDSVYREAVRIGATSGTKIWPAFRPDTIPMSFVVPSRGDVLFGWRGSAPPEYAPIPGMPAAFWREKRALGAASTGTMLEGKRVAQIVVQGSSALLAATAIHEAFHVFESASARPAARFGAGENSMLVSTYPVFDETNETAFALEGRILAASLRTADAGRKRELAREFVSVRRERHRRLDPEFATFDMMSELNEGLAEYALVRALIATSENGPRSWRQEASRARDARIPLLENLTRSDNLSLRFRYYQTGPAIGLLLDALTGDSWKQRMLDENSTLQDALARASGLEAAATAARKRAEAAFGGAALAAAAKREIADLQKRRRAMADSLLALPGLKLILRADSLPGKDFNSCGYDPQNLLQIGGNVQAQMRWWKPCAGGPTYAEFNVPSIHDEGRGSISAVIGADSSVILTSAGQVLTVRDGETRNNVAAFVLNAPRASVQAVRADVSRRGNTLVVVPKRAE